MEPPVGGGVPDHDRAARRLHQPPALLRPGPARGLREVGGDAIRVVTWNIRAAIGPGPFPDRWWTRIDADRLRAIGDVIRSLDPDLVALQELALASVDGALVDNAGDLARQLGRPVHYGAVRTFAVTDGDAVVGAGCFGNALIAREALGAVRTVALPQAAVDQFVEPPGTDHPAAGIRYVEAPDWIREPRCLLLGRMDAFTVGTAHLSHVGSGERLLQAATVADAMGDSTPALLLADLNAAAGAPELAPFDDWTDGFAEPTDDPARVSTDDGMAIDHLLARGASVQGCRVVREAGDLSDHFPVVAEVEAPG